MESFTPIPLPRIEEPPEYNTNYILYWHHVGLELNRITHTIGGPQAGPPVSARALGMIQLAVHDAYFAIKPSSFQTFLTCGADNPEYALPERNGADDARQAVAGAAVTMMSMLYMKPPTNPNPGSGATISDNAYAQLQYIIDKSVTEAPGGVDAASSSFKFGKAVAAAFFKLLFHAPGASPGNYHPTPGPYKFDDEPTNPVELVPMDANKPDGPKKPVRKYHGPLYGRDAKRFATQTEHIIADPPAIRSAEGEQAEYDDALREVIAMGGAAGLNSTKRSPFQTTQGLFWAYDGPKLIGTPPRLYNQIVRHIAVTYKKKDEDLATSEVNNADFARLLALVNRPLSGVRSDNLRDPNRPDRGDPFWLTLGAPNTNTNEIPFKPPFPAYPSGHATFGGAVFQMVRRYYNGRVGTWRDDEVDTIAIDMVVSEELNGLSRDLRQPYNPKEPITDQPGTVRTRVPRHFSSVWEMMFENAISRIFLGVHWRFDAAAAKDILIPTTKKDVYAVDNNGASLFQNIEDVKYTTKGTRRGHDGLFPIGGVPLGIEIANEIFDTKMRPTPPEKQPVPQPPFQQSGPSKEGWEKAGVEEQVPMWDDVTP